LIPECRNSAKGGHSIRKIIFIIVGGTQTGLPLSVVPKGPSPELSLGLAELKSILSIKAPMTLLIPAVIPNKISSISLVGLNMLIAASTKLGNILSNSTISRTILTTAIIISYRGLAIGFKKENIALIACFINPPYSLKCAKMIELGGIS